MDSSHAIAQNLSEEDAERLQKTIEQDEDVERYGSVIFWELEWTNGLDFP